MKKIDLFEHKLYLNECEDPDVSFNRGELVGGFWKDYGKSFSSSSWEAGFCRYNWEDVSARGICNHFKG